MPIYEKIVPLMQTRDWKACHNFLDGALVDADDDQRRSAHLWRAFVLEEEGRYGEAIDCWRTHRKEFNSQTMVDHQIARLYDRSGRAPQAIEELKSAPFGEEMDRHPALVLDGIYFYCYLLAREGREVPEKLLSALPHDFMYVQPRGNRTSKAELLSMIGRRRERRG
jgi:hypothetical protein